MRHALRAALLPLLFALAAPPADAAPKKPAKAASPSFTAPRLSAAGDIEVGNPAAKVTVVEYASLTCPHCAQFARDTLPQLMENEVRKGQVKYVFRHFVLNQPDLYASVIARCGGEKDYYRLIGLFFSSQHEWANEDFMARVDSLSGFPADRIEACRKDEALVNQLIASTQEALGPLKLTGTPTIIVNGEAQTAGEMTYAELAAVVAKAAGAADSRK